MENPHPKPTLPLLSIGLLLLLSAYPIPAKISLSVLGTYVQGQDSAFCANLARDLGQTLAEDTAFLVYDLRKKYALALDTNHRNGNLANAALLAPMHGGQVKWGLVAECREEKREDERGDYECRLRLISLSDAKVSVLDTIRFLPSAADKRKKWGQGLARPYLAHFLSKGNHAPSMGSLKVTPPANPAMLVRDMEVIRKGPISEVPLGATLVLGDIAGPLVISMENIHYILYPNSSYTYLLPKVVQLNSGALGILRGVDSASLSGKLKSATALDSSNLIWRNLAKVAALDSSNLVWRGLGKVGSLDSGNVLLNNMLMRGLGRATALDSTNLLFKTLGQVAAMDSSNLLLRTLGQVAALDSTNLVWKGLGKVSSLDSSNFLWRKLGQLAKLDSNSIWSKLGLLAFQDSTIVLTPSFIARGLPQAVLVRQEGNVSVLEVVKGNMLVHPLLGGGKSQEVAALHAVRTRGFAFRQDRMNPMRAGRILQEFESLDPAREARGLSMFLPGRLFSVGASLRTVDRPMQAFIVGGFRELDMEMDVLSSEKEGWNDFGATFRSSAQGAGCYLCSPDRLGP